MAMSSRLHLTFQPGVYLFGELLELPGIKAVSPLMKDNTSIRAHIVVVWWCEPQQVISAFTAIRIWYPRGILKWAICLLVLYQHELCSKSWIKKANKDSYPPLGPAHLTKLQHLTLVSLALQRRVSPLDLPAVEHTSFCGAKSWSI